MTLFKTKKPKTESIGKHLNERQVKAIEYIKNNSYITNKIYQELCNVSKATATRDLSDLTDNFKL